MNQVSSVNVGIIGATGYAGEELLRLLLRHPRVMIEAMSSVSFSGQSIDSIYPSLHDICDKILTNQDDVINQSDIIFACLPHGLSEPIAEKVVKQGKYLIDLGADFRLDREEDYKKWYGLSYQQPWLRDVSCYCIPELHRQRLQNNIHIIANPGCYPTSIALGVAPALSAGLVHPTGMIIDSKSGVTGAGRALTQTTHFPDCHEAFGAYKIAQHRHIPEIEQTLSQLAKQEISVTFVPHLLPVNRGILSTIYLPLKRLVTIEEVRNCYQKTYGKQSFVRMLPLGETANLKQVTYSNYCDLSLHIEARTQTLIVVSAIDNMVKGAAGQAIQNMNLLCGMPEKMGIDMVPTGM